MESAQPSDWRRPDPANTLYMELPGGRVIIELAPRFAPLHVANIKQLVRGEVLRRPAVVRVQDNFVAQWGDVDKTRPTEAALRKLPDETVIAWGKGLPFIKLPDAGWLRARDRLDRRLSRGRRAQAFRARRGSRIVTACSASAAKTGRTPAAAPSSTW